MFPRNWPNAFFYSPESIASEISIHLLRACYLSCPRDLQNRIEPLLDLQQVHPHIEIRKITAHLKYKNHSAHPLAGRRTKLGYIERGIFASHHIPKDTVLGEYVGEMFVISTNESFNEYLLRPISQYLWWLNFSRISIVIDAKNLANELVFTNDYRGIKDFPNTKARWIAHRGIYYFCYVTTCDVPGDEEILVDYGEEFWKNS